MQNNYNVILLPQATVDFEEIINYMLNELDSPATAEHFLDDFEDKKNIISLFPYAGAIYRGNPKLKYKYRMIFVGNYTVFYTILENIVEIHRIIYSTRNFNDII